MDDSRAATTLASAQRGKAARKEARQQKDAASKVAAIQRGRQQRTTARKENAAAVVLQSRERGRAGSDGDGCNGDGSCGSLGFEAAGQGTESLASVARRRLDAALLADVDPDPETDLDKASALDAIGSEKATQIRNHTDDSGSLVHCDGQSSPLPRLIIEMSRELRRGRRDRGGRRLCWR